MTKRYNVVLFLIMALIMTVTVVLAENDSSAVTEIKGHNLSLDSSITIIYYVKSENVPSGAESGMLIWTEPQESYVYGTQNKKLKASGQQTIDGVTYDIFYFTGLGAKKMVDDIYSVSYIRTGNDITYSDVDKYSILQYLYDMSDSTDVLSEDGTTLGDTISHIKAYGAAAQNFFGYKKDKLATDQFATIELVNGHLQDNTKSGLYKVGSMVHLIADNIEGKEFSHWEDSQGNILTTEKRLDVRVAAGNNPYIAVFDDEHSKVTYTVISDGVVIGELSKGNSGITENDILPLIAKDKYLEGVYLDSGLSQKVVFPYSSSTDTSIYLNIERGTYVEYHLHWTSETRPETIEIYLKKDGDIVDTQVIDGSSNSYSWSNLPYGYYGANINSEYWMGGDEPIEDGDCLYHFATLDYYGVGFTSGSGTYEDPYHITEKRQLNDIRPDCYYILDNDITFTEDDYSQEAFNCGNEDCGIYRNWNMYYGYMSYDFGQYFKPVSILFDGDNVGFTGGFNGNGHSINGIRILRENYVDDGYGGFFGSEIIEENVQNLTVNSVIVDNDSLCPEGYVSYKVIGGKTFRWSSRAVSRLGSRVVIEAFIPEGYEFDHWEDNNGVNVGTQPWDYVIVTPTSNVFTAVLRKQDPLKYTSNGNGTCRVTGYNYIPEDGLVIPEYNYAGDKVVCIGINAFKDCTALKSVLIPDSVTEIQDFAFYGTDLTSIEIPDSVTRIGQSAMANCSKLKTVKLSANMDQIHYFMFEYDTKLESVSLSDKTISILMRAFYLTNVKTIDIIGSEENLYKVIPLFDHSNNTEGISKSYALLLNGNPVTQIVVPSGVTALSNNAFRGCNNVKSIVIPESVASIGENAFVGCSDLETIYFTGTEEEWNSIVSGSTIPDSVNIVFNYIVE